MYSGVNSLSELEHPLNDTTKAIIKIEFLFIKFTFLFYY
ncbi:hypothetical protein NBRC3257_2839 [Gluconobacter thailandicus NBRC 3257]|uniref:Transposase n=1 Tax=Gluconobacter thailandicus NBRC 3257 TaxID=1381097 RepID=A0ABQ0J068_GLUTH|nr:hypothetical protein NBRC3257_2839 [Gluconobacter thailandicus NBRC 3257]